MLSSTSVGWVSVVISLYITVRKKCNEEEDNTKKAHSPNRLCCWLRVKENRKEFGTHFMNDKAKRHLTFDHDSKTVSACWKQVVSSWQVWNLRQLENYKSSYLSTSQGSCWSSFRLTQQLNEFVVTWEFLRHGKVTNIGQHLLVLTEIQVDHLEEGLVRNRNKITIKLEFQFGTKISTKKRGSSLFNNNNKKSKFFFLI